MKRSITLTMTRKPAPLFLRLQPLAATFVAGVAVITGTSLPARAAPCGDPPTVLIVLDRSASMNAGGKWSAAVTAVDTLLVAYQNSAALGLMVFPAPESNCGPGVVVVPPAPGARDAIVQALGVNAPPAMASTPIVDSLDAARASLSAMAGKRSVILITDGAETCRPAPAIESGSCDSKGGTVWRKCGDCGRQACLATGVWASDCVGDESFFSCPAAADGSCNADGTCASASWNGPAKRPGTSAAELLSAGITTYAIGFGGGVDPGSLSAIATQGGTERYYQVDGLSALQTALNKILDDLSCTGACGNGVLDAGELCDPAIASGQTGACPASCDDHDACTQDQSAGSACMTMCSHTAIGASLAAPDGCCPKNASVAEDVDCPTDKPPVCSGGGGPDDHQKRCIDPLCEGVVCDADFACEKGKCLPLPTTGPVSPPTDTAQVNAGCDCNAGSPSAGSGMAALVGLALLALRRRRRRS